jgi:5'-3' exonuclease
MGIPSYYKRLIDSVPDLLKRGHPSCKINYLWLDFNCMIYHCLRRPDIPAYPGEEGRLAWEANLMEEIVKYCQKVVAEVKPADGVFIAVDGVVPMAKMRQQRLRRFKPASDPAGWDTNAITPGTAFMDRLRQRLAAMCASHVNWRLSGADQPGEGEHKIMNEWRSGGYGADVTHAVYGLDADLIVLSLLNSVGPVWLFREEVEAGVIKRDECGEEAFTWFDIVGLKGIITASCPSIKEYCCAMSFLGNDFLPAGLSLKMREDGHQVLLDLLAAGNAAAGGLLLAPSGEIDAAGLAGLIGRLAAVEEKRTLAFIKKKLRQAGTIGTERLFGENNWPLECAEEGILLSGGGLRADWQDIYLKVWFGKGVRKEDLCRTYLEGIHWIWNYYRGKPVCYNWHYPWSLPPLWNWLAGISACTSAAPAHRIGPDEIKPASQLALVLPLRSWHLIPAGCQQRHLPVIAPWLFPTKFDYFSVGKRFFWECEPEIPVASIIEINAICASTSG